MHRRGDAAGPVGVATFVIEEDVRFERSQDFRLLDATQEERLIHLNSPIPERRDHASVRRGIPREVLELVDAPTLAVAGQRDSRSVNRTSLELVSRGIPGSLTAIAPGMHHQWNIEDVELFTSALRTWLASGGIDTGLVARRG